MRAILEGDDKCGACGFEPRVQEAIKQLEKQFNDLYDKMKWVRLFSAGKVGA